MSSESVSGERDQTIHGTYNLGGGGGISDYKNALEARKAIGESEARKKKPNQAVIAAGVKAQAILSKPQEELQNKFELAQNSDALILAKHGFDSLSLQEVGDQDRVFLKTLTSLHKFEPLGKVGQDTGVVINTDRVDRLFFAAFILHPS